jgi:hypothetical protein
VPLRTLVSEGEPTESLVKASQDAGLLVLGIRGRPPVAGLLPGSVRQGAAATASCPVVLVKLTDQPGPGAAGRACLSRARAVPAWIASEHRLSARGGKMSEREGRGAACTEERGSLRPSDEGRRRLKAARKRAGGTA